MADFYRDDLLDFVHYGRLDAYDLTDEDLAYLLEVWRWSVWRQRSSPADDVREAAHDLQRHLAQTHNVEVEYNTALLLRQEIEPLIYLRVLTDFPKAVGYCLRHGLALIRAIYQQRRYQHIIPVRNTDGAPLGYPRQMLDQVRLRPPDVLHRPYWRQLNPHNFEQRKRLDDWW
jgi:hypothetical protein